MTPKLTALAHGPRRPWLVVLTATAAVLALLMLAGGAELLMPAEQGDGTALGELNAAIGRVKGPATVLIGTLSGMGLLAGGAMTAIGLPQGLRMMTMSAVAICGVLLGNGIVA
ncbi:hypothetical protein VSS74_31320 [Conexibacter stalactiti]|uniref:TrbC/VIRB2 family protein n=1 Tax=Conexibacter stalactiti TaxID=1940611 RepID=A0ABU4HZX4_9ACTN|nr:hypothetical protein [Conexibacter stalactiti]MDW5598891.1 hypothetical protein [Conexibacter stalactiti]MEC5039533.1 hypothetical protein [Conexibacter stalactiti]